MVRSVASGGKIYRLLPDKENTAQGKCQSSSEINWLTQSQRLREVQYFACSTVLTVSFLLYFAVQEANTSEKCNGFESESTARTANTFNSLKEEQERNKSMLDSIMQGSSTKILSNTALGKEENTRTESTNSDANLKLKSSSPQLHDFLSSSKDVFSDDNYDDAFIEHCTKCMTRLSQDMCPTCNKDIFPSHAATPRKHLSPCRFYSSNYQKLRTYSGTKKQGTGVPRLCAAPDTKPSSTKKSVGSSQATSGRKKRKNQGKVS